MNKHIKIIRDFVFCIIWIYGIFLSWFYVVQDRFVFQPPLGYRTPADMEATDFQTVTITPSDGLALVAWYRPPPTSTAPVMVFFHGSADVVSNWVGHGRAYARLGVGVLLVEYRGFGPNPGKPSEKGLIADAHAAVAFLQRQGVAAERLILYGHSLGTGVAVAMAAAYSVRLVLLEAPFTAEVDVTAHHYPHVPARLLMKHQFRSDLWIKDVKAPVVIVHGDQDRVIPVEQAKNLAALVLGKVDLHILNGAGHGNLYPHGAFDIFQHAVVKYGL